MGTGEHRRQESDREWVAAATLFVGPVVSAALVGSAVVALVSGRLGRGGWRVLLYAFAVPLGLLLGGNPIPGRRLDRSDTPQESGGIRVYPDEPELLQAVSYGS